MAIARAAAMNKCGAMMLVVLLLIIVVEVSAMAAAAEPSCNIPVTELVQCVVDVVKSKSIVQPKCCNRLAEEIGCGCVLREILKNNGYDPQKPFCPTGTACDKV